MKNTFIFLLMFIQSLTVFGQNSDPPWDNTLSKTWPETFAPVEIKSSLDGTMQKAIFRKNIQPKPMPLIVSLHTWSGDYLQEDPLAPEILLRGWNYIHPDFRGPNIRPEAGGSKLVISDIEDAIRFAIENGNVDENEVHIIGVSGGGHATLLSFMTLDYPVKSFNVWASISNLEDWYWESEGRGLRYARDIEKITTGGNAFDAEEIRTRSPLYLPFPVEKRKGASLHIYAGIHDGYTGSVPITHSINMFNQLLGEMYPRNLNERVSDSLKLELVTKRITPPTYTDQSIAGRKIHLQRKLPTLSLTIFEGGHEMLVPEGLLLIPVYGTKSVRPTKN